MDVPSSGEDFPEDDRPPIGGSPNAASARGLAIETEVAPLPRRTAEHEQSAVSAASVLILADYGGSYRGSFIPMLLALGDRCKRRGWNVEFGFTAVARDRHWLADFAQAGLPVHFAPEAGRRGWKSWISGLLDGADGPTLIHTHFSSFDLAAMRAARAARDTAVVWHVHSAFPPGWRSTLKMAVKHGILGRRVASVVCVSDATRTLARRRGAGAHQTMTIPNGIDAGRFRPSTHEGRRRARDLLRLPSTAPIVVHFAWNWELKGGPLFMDAFVRLLDHRPDAIAVIVGGGARAVREAELRGIGNSVQVADPIDQVRVFYDAADVIAATSPVEGGPPLAVLEALGTGATVVATDTPSHRLSGGPDSIILAEPDPESLAAAISRALDSNGVDRSLGHEWVLQHSSLDTWTQAVAGVYERALLATGG